jgi:uncharacterized pyridoxamine 5'-phosphate oxidase family protein
LRAIWGVYPLKVAKSQTKVLQELATINIMILATSKKDIVTARSMSIIMDNNKIYFQTGKLMDKYDQLVCNENVALCMNNIQIQGSARDIGSWIHNQELLSLYKKKHNNSYELYGNMKTQTVIEITIKNIKKWEYVNGKPYIYFIDFENETFENKEYDLSK